MTNCPDNPFILYLFVIAAFIIIFVSLYDSTTQLRIKQQEIVALDYETRELRRTLRSTRQSLHEQPATTNEPVQPENPTTDRTYPFTQLFEEHPFELTTQHSNSLVFAGRACTTLQS